MFSKRFIKAFCTVLFIVICLAVILVQADEPDEANGIVNLGDRVVYFSDDDGDGLFEKNAAIVIDDTRAAAALFNQPIAPGQRVNLRVFGNGKSRVRDYEVFLVKRGRALGQYVPLATANH